MIPSRNKELMATKPGGSFTDRVGQSDTFALAASGRAIGKGFVAFDREARRVQVRADITGGGGRAVQVTPNFGDGTTPIVYSMSAAIGGNSELPCMEVFHEYAEGFDTADFSLGIISGGRAGTCYFSTTGTTQTFTLTE